MGFDPTEWHPEPVRREERRAPGMPASGWLPDPSETDLERYWDGARWTSRVRNRHTRVERGVTPAAYSAPARSWTLPDQPTRPSRSARRTGARRFWTTTVVVLATLLAVSGFAYRVGLIPEGVDPATAAVDALAGLAEPESATPPADATVAYPVHGSSDLVRHLAAGMITQEESIAVGYWVGPDGDALLSDALLEAATQNPYVFVSGWTTTTLGARVTVQPTYIYPADEAERRRVETADAVQVGLAASGAASATTAAEKVSLIHDYVASVATYDHAAAAAIDRGEDSAIVDRSQEAYGILVEGTAVCGGYAQAFLAMADAAGLDAVAVTGFADGGLTSGAHAWNKVLVDGRWLTVDVTWDDADQVGEILHDYLLIPDGDQALLSRTADADWMLDSHLGDYGA
ncbi:DUF2510 domain-containing protein [Demequina silvatica]|uniref:DUF2510 domain-containing protein n=1 Tax=Demequina silvatica TaxID=1638988 RepID=UPI0007861AB8|nr:DUF2510 domain-containing protein [Demequina silvatica]